MSYDLHEFPVIMQVLYTEKSVVNELTTPTVTGVMICMTLYMILVWNHGSGDPGISSFVVRYIFYQRQCEVFYYVDGGHGSTSLRRKLVEEG